ncbi:MAG: ribosome silencing factor [Verrucomicrobia bacterium]|nr:ribosome silencing factor [Verrucomicrobiota bacterium]
MPTKPTTDSILPLLKQIVLALEEKKAGDLRVLDVSEKSTITDYLVLATGTSEPHLRALRVELEKVLDAAKVPIAGMDAGTYGSGWTVVDAYQIMMHVFTPEQRENYALEKLWKDAKDIDLPTLLTEPKTKPVRKVTRNAPAKKKTAVKKVPTKKAIISKAKKPAVKKKSR